VASACNWWASPHTVELVASLCTKLFSFNRIHYLCVHEKKLLDEIIICVVLTINPYCVQGYSTKSLLTRLQLMIRDYKVAHKLKLPKSKLEVSQIRMYGSEAD